MKHAVTKYTAMNKCYYEEWINGSSMEMIAKRFSTSVAIVSKAISKGRENGWKVQKSPRIENEIKTDILNRLELKLRNRKDKWSDMDSYIMQLVSGRA